jgi:hypothetical protein
MSNDKDLNQKNNKAKERMKFLLEQMPVNLFEKQVKAKLPEEKTPEMLAMENDHLQVLEYLLNYAKNNPEFKVSQIGSTIVTENTQVNPHIQGLLDAIESNPHLWKNTYKFTELDSTDTTQAKLKGMPEVGIAPNKVKDILATLRDNPNVDTNTNKPK